MITYPNTYGVFEEDLIDQLNLVRSYEGLVYIDGANLNSLMGLSTLG